MEDNGAGRIRGIDDLPEMMFGVHLGVSIF